MKPLYGESKRLSRCRCCQSGFSKHNAGGSKKGNASARGKSKTKIKKELKTHE